MAMTDLFADDFGNNGSLHGSGIALTNDDFAAGSSSRGNNGWKFSLSPASNADGSGLDSNFNGSGFQHG